MLNDDKPQFLFPEWQMFLFVIAGLYVCYLLFGRGKNKKPDLPKFPEQPALMLQYNKERYHNWLSAYNPYYNSLTKDMQEVFLHRVSIFIQSKQFKFHSLAEEEYIPVLISGAAVQLTFGLHNYTMDYFDVIHIISREYVLNIDDETYYGHVSRNGIYISWNHFLQGYENYTDCKNVGLHEMAHAISFDIFLGEQDNNDYKFRKRLEMFAESGRPVFRAMRKGASHLLDDYGATNFDEFWAVCVESFFENTAVFKQEEPVLSHSVCYLLNQDPLLENKIINPKLAGLVY